MVYRNLFTTTKVPLFDCKFVRELHHLIMTHEITDLAKLESCPTSLHLQGIALRIMGKSI